MTTTPLCEAPSSSDHRLSLCVRYGLSHQNLPTDGLHHRTKLCKAEQLLSRTFAVYLSMPQRSHRPRIALFDAYGFSQHTFTSEKLSLQNIAMRSLGICTLILLGERSYHLRTSLCEAFGLMPAYHLEREAIIPELRCVKPMALCHHIVSREKLSSRNFAVWCLWPSAIISFGELRCVKHRVAILRTFAV
jgi:hypothetical protein